MATTPKDTSLSSAFRYAIDQPLENMATTFQALGMEGWEKFMRDIVEEPENYEAAAGRFIGKQGENFNWEYFPRAIFEQAGQIAGSLATRVGGTAIGATAGPGGAVAGALLGPALFEAVQIAGPVALERAKNEGRTEPNWEDWTGALGTAAASGVLNAVGIKNVGVLNSIGKGALKQAGKQTVKAGVAEGLTEGAQGSLEQIGGSALTAQGLQFDPKAALGEGLLGAGAGTGTQIGTQVGAKVVEDARTKDMQEGFIDIKNLFGKKKETPVTPPTPERFNIEERIAETQARRNEQIRNTLPKLSPVFDNLQDLDFVDTQIIRGTDQELNAEMFQREVLPDLQLDMEGFARTQGFDLTPEITNEVLRDVLTEVGTHPETYTQEAYDEYGDDEAFIQFDQNAVFNQAKKMLSDVFDTTPRASNALPSGQFEIDEPRPLFNKVPGIPPILESINYARPANNDFDVMPSLGAVNPEFDPRTIDLLQNSPKGPIDPVFMSHSPLWAHLQNVTKKPIPAEDMMKNLFFGVRSTEETPAAKEHGTFKPVPSKKNAKKSNEIATQAIEARIGEFLLDRAEKGETVTKDEVLKVLQDHRGRFTTTMLSEDGNWVDGTEYRTSAIPALEAWAEGKLAEFMEQEIKKSDILPEGYNMGAANQPTSPLPNGEDAFVNEYVDVVEPKVEDRLQKELESEGVAALLPFMVEDSPTDRAIEPYKPQYPNQYAYGYFLSSQPDFKMLGNAVEIGLKYDPRTSPEVEQDVQTMLKESGSLEQANFQKVGDPAFIKNADSAHYWMGPGMLGWIRGGMYSHEDGARGLLLHEIQSNYHAVTQDPDKPKMYRSHVRDASDMTKTDRKQLRIGDKLMKAYQTIDAGNDVRPANLALRVLGVAKNYTEDMLPGNSGRLVAETKVSPSIAFETFSRGLSPTTRGNFENLMDQLYEETYAPQIKHLLKKDLLEKQPLQEIAGYTFKEDAFLNDYVDGIVRYVGRVRDLGGTSQDAWQRLYTVPLVENGIFDRSGYAEMVEAAEKIQQMFREADAVVADNLNNKAKLFEALQPLATDMVANDPNLGTIYTMLKDGGETPQHDFPNFEEYKNLRNMVKAEGVEERNILADAPLKKDFPQAMVQASISKILMSDPDVNYLYIPSEGFGGAPQSVYKNAIKEAKRISKQFEPNLEFKRVTEFRHGEKDVVVYALEIGPLREKIILEGGFPGKMTGGLVEKATNQTFNLGDYGRRFI